MSAIRHPRSEIEESLPSVELICLGCAKNLVDGERLLGHLGAAGFPLALVPGEADVVLINTCGFLAEAVEESLDVIEEERARKEAGERKAVIVLGCLPSRVGAEGAVDGVDGWFGIGDPREIEKRLRDLGTDEGSPRRARAVSNRFLPPKRLKAEGGRLRLTPPHWAYLRITEGCDNRCRYCTIPAIRGPLRCKPLEDIVKEAEELAGSGMREAVLIGQDTAAWRDETGRGLEAVIEALHGVEALEAIRVLYAHPAHVTPAIVDALASGGKVLPYLDLPVQHASDPVLRAMGRRTSAGDLESLVETLRERIEGLVLRTTVMAGFPGETEEDFETLLGFLERTRIERCGVFAYSPEAGTEAAGFPGRVDPGTVEARADALRTLAAKLRDDFHERRVGAEARAAADGREAGVALCRTYAEAPEADPYVLVPGDAPPGHAGTVRITGIEGPDLRGEWVG